MGLNQAMNFTGVLLFAGLMVWDSNRLKQLSTQLEGKQGMGCLAVWTWWQPTAATE